MSQTRRESMQRPGLLAIVLLLACALLPSAAQASGSPAHPRLDPKLSIVGVRILHLVNGKEVDTQYLRTGEYAEFLVLYSTTGVSSVAATVDVTKNGKKLGSVLLQPVSTYAGHPARGWIFGFTRNAGLGKFYAHFRLSAPGGLTAKRDRKVLVTLH